MDKEKIIAIAKELKEKKNSKLGFSNWDELYFLTDFNVMKLSYFLKTVEKKYSDLLIRFGYYN